MISKENFIKYINKLKELYDIQNAINEAGCKLENFTISFAEYEQIVVDILIDTFDDKEDWLSYYIYEINFGRDYKPGTISINGKDVLMSNAGELYDLLMENISLPKVCSFGDKVYEKLYNQDKEDIESAIETIKNIKS
jgi:hypothetical protein